MAALRKVSVEQNTFAQSVTEATKDDEHVTSALAELQPKRGRSRGKGKKKKQKRSATKGDDADADGDGVGEVWPKARIEAMMDACKQCLLAVFNKKKSLD